MEVRYKSSFIVSGNRGKTRTNLPMQALASDPIPPKLRETLSSEIIEAVLSVYHDVEKKKGGLLEEIRLRAYRNASLTIGGENYMLHMTMNSTELFSLLTQMCGGSLYAYSQNINEGFLTLEGGIRVGVAGLATCENGYVVGVRDISGLCIRIPHVHGTVGREMADLLRHMKREHGDARGILLYAPPGVGKTTLLKGVASHLASGDQPLRTVVVDTRGELFFPPSEHALCLDVLTGYPRGLGISIATRSLGAQVILCDEIGDGREAMSLMAAYHGGVPLIATAHGQTLQEILKRTGLKLLHKSGIFGAYVGLRRDGGGGFFYDITPREVLDDGL